MFILKSIYHINAYIKLVIFKFLYGSRLKVGRGTTWRKSFLVTIMERGNIVIGQNCFFNNYCSINSRSSIKIGDNTIFGENVKIYDHNHRFNKKSAIKEQGYSIGEISIGSNCWIASNVTILKGAIIEDNCVIGANVVVNGRVPEGTIMRITEKSMYQFDDIRFS